jgi:hypothetical protein
MALRRGIVILFEGVKLMSDLKEMSCMFCFLLLVLCLAVGAAGRVSWTLAYFPYIKKIVMKSHSAMFV